MCEYISDELNVFYVYFQSQPQFLTLWFAEIIAE